MEYRADGFSDVMRLYRSQTAQTGEVWIPDYDLAEKYQYNGLFSKIIDRPAEEACKHGLDYNVSDSELAAYLDDALDRLDWEEKATAAIRWARLFGGAIIVMLLDDGRGLEEPVNWQDIRSVEELRVYERAVVQPDPEVYRSGTAEYFDISSTYGGTFRVHRSRCLIFKNGTLPEYGTAQQYYYWGLPEYIRIKRDLSIALKTHTNAANMIEKSVQPVYKQRGLQSMLAGPNGDDMELKRLQVLDASRGMMNTIAIDMEGEEYDFKTFQMSGTKEILDSACNLLSAVTCIPQTILFGRSPAGENATGESDLENYYNFVEGIQKRMLKKNVRTLIKAIVQAGIYDGSIAENPGIIKPSFPPLWSLTETERAQVDLVRAQTEQANAQTVQMYMDMQIIGPEEVRQALAKNGKLIAEQIPEQEESADWEELLNSLAQNSSESTEKLSGQKAPSGDIIKAEPFSSDGISVQDGGEGSGNFNHEGRPGKVGGSGEGGGSSSKSESKEKSYTGKISRKVYPNERAFKNNRVEKAAVYDDDGSVIFEKTGSERQVRISRQDLVKFKGKVFTHSHPQDVTLSPADLMRMQEYEIKQVRAVTSKGVYVAGYTGKWKKQFKNDEELKQYELSIDKEALKTAISKHESKEWTQEYADNYYQHKAVQKMSEELGFDYRFIPWEEAEDE